MREFELEVQLSIGGSHGKLGVEEELKVRL
jgi:hypothetical protein